MSSTVKKVVTVISIAAFGVLGGVIPASAGTHVAPKNVWCC
jgi:hypothetical protein